MCIAVSFWAIGSAFVVFLAGLQSIPQDLYEAITVDGAGTLRRFWHVTLPMLCPVILFNLVIGMIISFQVFDIGLGADERRARATRRCSTSSTSGGRPSSSSRWATRRRSPGSCS